MINLEWSKIHATAARAGKILVEFSVLDGVKYEDEDCCCLIGAEYVNVGSRTRPEVTIALFVDTWRIVSSNGFVLSPERRALTLDRVHAAFTFLEVPTIDVRGGSAGVVS